MTFLKLAFILKLLSYVLGIQSLSNNVVLSILSWNYSFKSLIRNRNLFPIFLALLFFPKVRLGLGRFDADKISLSEHLFRYFSFGKADALFPPQIPLWHRIKNFIQFGLWERHKMQDQNFKNFGPVYCSYSLIPPKMTVFISNPKDVERVLVEKESFPTRVGAKHFSLTKRIN